MLPSLAAVAGRLPDVPCRGGEGAEAHAGLRHRGGGRAGGARQEPQGEGRARRRARIPADQPSARLPHLRPGRRVRAAGLRVPGGPRPARATASTPSATTRSRTSAPTSCTSPTAASSAPAASGSWRTSQPEPVLNVSERGDRAYIGISDEQPLDHPWAGNVVDLCPVGSLLSKDFLHKARAWDLDKTASVCPGCTQGCNIMHRHPGRRRRPAPPAPQSRRQPPLHLRPRPLQLPLDESWRPGRGAAGARRRRDTSRPTGTPRWTRLGELVRAHPGPVVHPRLRPRLDRVARLVRHLVEGRSVTAAVQVPLGEEAPLPGVPDLALRRERAPNVARRGAPGLQARLGRRACAASGAAVVIVLDAELDRRREARAAARDAHAGAAATCRPTRCGMRSWSCRSRPWPRRTACTSTATAGCSATTRPRRRPGWRVRPGGSPAKCSRARGRTRTRQPPPPRRSRCSGDAWPVFAGLTHADLGFTGRVLAEPATPPAEPA